MGLIEIRGTTIASISDLVAFDRDVRLRIYQHFLDAGGPPSTDETAQALGASQAEIAAAYDRLATERVVVLRPGTREILMANPLSAVPTRFRVELAGRAYWGNCIWDALGIPAMLHENGQIAARCGDCDEPIELGIEGPRLTGAGVVHFAVPARHWWDDIIFT